MLKPFYHTCFMVWQYDIPSRLHSTTMQHSVESLSEIVINYNHPRFSCCWSRKLLWTNRFSVTFNICSGAIFNITRQFTIDSWNTSSKCSTAKFTSPANFLPSHFFFCNFFTLHILLKHYFQNSEWFQYYTAPWAPLFPCINLCTLNQTFWLQSCHQVLVLIIDVKFIHVWLLVVAFVDA